MHSTKYQIVLVRKSAMSEQSRIALNGDGEKRHGA